MSVRIVAVFALVLILLVPVIAAGGPLGIADISANEVQLPRGDGDRGTPWIGDHVADIDGPAVFLLGFDEVPGSGTVDRLRPRVDDLLAFRHVPVVAVVATSQDVLGLRDTPGLLSIMRDRPLEYHQLPEASHTNWASTGHTETRADRAHALGYDGSGVGVAVVDTGINSVPPHPGLLPADLGGPVAQNVKILLGREATSIGLPSPVNLYAEDQPSTDESGGHGTHVASIIAGQGTADGRFAGRAPGAHLIGLSTGVSTSILYAVAAYDYILEHHETYNIRVINNSYGSAGPYQPLDPLVLAIEAADEAGILSVFSASNRGPDERTLNTYAQSPYVLAVGAATPGGAVATFSSRGSPDAGKPGPDLVAPGFLTIGARSNAASAMDQTGRTPVLDSAAIPTMDLPHYRTLSGTSMASPQVAAIAALLVQADPTLTPAQLRAVLTETTRPLQGHWYIAQGNGHVDAEAALRHVLGLDMDEADWMRPVVIERDGNVHRYPFHGAAVGADLDLSAFHQENQFPVRTPVEAFTVDFEWQPLNVVGGASAHEAPLRFTLVAPDGTALIDEAFPDAGPQERRYTISPGAVEAHNIPGWSSGPWNAILHAAGGAGSYDVTVNITYADGVLPEVVRTTPPPPPPLPERVPHPPIRILSDADFTAENGVVGGSGTASDPYIIEGWEIDPPEGAGLAIGGTGALGEPGAGTTKHVVVRNVRVLDSPDWCVMLDSARHVTIKDSLFDGCNWALYAKGSTTDVRILDSSFAFNEHAIALYGVRDMLVQGNTITDPIDGGIVVSQGVVGLSTHVASSGVRIVENTLHGDRGDIRVATPGATDVDVVRNRLGAGGDIVLASLTAGNRVSGTQWLDGRQRIEQSVLAQDPGAIVPLNTIVDAGSDHSVEPGATYCFEDARVDAGPGEMIDIVTWDFGDGTTVEGETNPCHTYEQAGTWPVELVVTLQPAAGERYTLEDSAIVTTG